MFFLRQSTAVDIAIAPFLDATDGVTPESGLTIAQADVRLKKNNGAWAQVNDATSATYEEGGWYEKELDATDTNTVGILIISVQEAGALPVWHQFQVLEEVVYDALFASGALGYVANAPVNVAQFGGVNLTAAGGRPEVNLTHIAGAAVSTTTAQLGVNVVQVSGDATAADNAEAFFDGTGYAGTNNVIPSVTTVTGNVNGSVASVTGAVGSVTGNVGGNVGGNVTGSVGSVATNGISAASLAADAGTEIGTAVWATTTRVLTAGTNIALAKGTGVTGFNDLDAAGVRSAVGLASANLDTQLSAIGTLVDALPTAAENADAVWDEPIAGHLGAGSTGEALNAAGAAGDPWTTTLPGAYSSGQAGFIVGTNLDAAISSRLATGGYTAPLDAAGTRTAIGLASANLDTQLGALPTADENADALLKRDWTAITGEAARSVLNALRFLRNKWSLSGTTVTKEDDTTAAWTATVTTSASAEPVTGSDPS